MWKRQFEAGSTQVYTVQCAKKNKVVCNVESQASFTSQFTVWRVGPWQSVWEHPRSAPTPLHWHGRWAACHCVVIIASSPYHHLIGVITLRLWRAMISWHIKLRKVHWTVKLGSLFWSPPSPVGRMGTWAVPAWKLQIWHLGTFGTSKASLQSALANWSPTRRPESSPFLFHFAHFTILQFRLKLKSLWVICELSGLAKLPSLHLCKARAVILRWHFVATWIGVSWQRRPVGKWSFSFPVQASVQNGSEGDTCFYVQLYICSSKYRNISSPFWVWINKILEFLNSILF